VGLTYLILEGNDALSCQEVDAIKASLSKTVVSTSIACGG
jgi:hypothetical protein